MKNYKTYLFLICFLFANLLLAKTPNALGSDPANNKFKKEIGNEASSVARNLQKAIQPFTLPRENNLSSSGDKPSFGFSEVPGLSIQNRLQPPLRPNDTRDTSEE